jgi:hypothetical protein
LYQKKQIKLPAGAIPRKEVNEVKKNYCGMVNNIGLENVAAGGTWGEKFVGNDSILVPS